MKSSIIRGLGYYVPENRITNKDLESKMNTSHEWIIERTGIEERRLITKGTESTHDLAHRAAMNAIENAKLTPQDIDFIIFATLSPDYYFPGNGVLLQESLGCDTVGALDIRNQCSGFVYGLSVADKFIKTGTYKNILVVGAEVHSFVLDMTTRGRAVSVIFGDGAGAVILGASDEKGKGILTTDLHSEGKYAEELAIKFPGSKYGWIDSMLEEGYEPDYEKIYPYMNGSHVFKHAVIRFEETILNSLKNAGYELKDLDLLIPHQANLRISQFIKQKLELRDDQVFNNINKYGNTTAASIPIALSEAFQENRIKEGDLVCMPAFGSGFAWGSVLIRF